MCVIAVKPAGVKWPGHTYMKNCFDSNNDGAGIAWVDEEGLKVRKGYFKWQQLWKDIKALEKYPVLLHCRLATHGSKNANNCHPFVLENGVVMAHNGIISGVTPTGDETDSEAFGKLCIGNIPIELLKTEGVQKLIGMAIGGCNKIAMIDSTGEFIIINAEQGKEFEGIWFSNDSYLDRGFYGYRPMFSYRKKHKRKYGVNKGETHEWIYGQCGWCDEYRCPKWRECETEYINDEAQGYFGNDYAFYALPGWEVYGEASNGTAIKEAV